MKRIYLDYAATTPVDELVLKEMLPYFSQIFGNPSSIHYFGKEAKIAVERSRAIISSLIGALEEEIIFTSGGTESNNFAIKGIALANENRGNHIITSSIEHHAVLEPCEFLEKHGFKVTYLPVDKYGLVDPDDVKKAITKNTILISIMHANNEIGTIEPIAEIGKIAKDKDIYFHTDAVQTFAHIPINVNELNIDLLSASSHKLYGPKGIGAIYIRKNTRIKPFMHGGAQEKGLRASTLNVPGIVGFGKAAQIAEKNMNLEMETLKRLRDKLIKAIPSKIEHTSLNGHPTKRLPNNVNITIEFVEGEAMLLSLDFEGISCSTGSACSSLALKSSHVLTALGKNYELSHSSLRFSLGRYTTDEDIDRVIDTLPKIVNRLRTISPLYKSSCK